MPGALIERFDHEERNFRRDLLLEANQSAVVHATFIERAFCSGLTTAAQHKPRYVVTIGGHPEEHDNNNPAKFVSRVSTGFHLRVARAALSRYARQ